MLPEVGHINATLRIARRLLAAGAEVFYLRFSSSASALGLVQVRSVTSYRSIYQEPLRFNDDNPELFQIEALSSKPLSLLSDQAHSELGCLRARLKVLATDIQPDLVLIDAVLPRLAMLAASEGVRLDLLNTSLFNPIDLGSTGFESLISQTEIILCPREFDFLRAAKRCRHIYAEPSVDTEREEVPFPWEGVREDRQLVYCAIGSHVALLDPEGHFLQLIADVFEELADTQLVVSGMSRPADLRGDSIWVEEAPQLALLQRARMMISHGGLGSIKECVFHRVPMLIFPFIPEQSLNAGRIEYHGLGMRGGHQTARIDSVREMADTVLNSPSIRANLARMSDIFRRYDERSSSIDLILEHATHAN